VVIMQKLFRERVYLSLLFPAAGYLLSGNLFFTKKVQTTYNRIMNSKNHDNPRVLIVDDDANVRRLLELYLNREGYRVSQAGDGVTALQQIEEKQPDLLILDVMLPEIDGWEICRRIRVRNSDLPIIFLTAKDAPQDRIAGLDMGGDDYVIKPFDPNELTARVRARLRRREQPVSAEELLVVSTGNLTVNLSSFEVKVEGKTIRLKPKEVQLLYFLATNPNRVFSRELLLERIWGYDFAGESRTVDVHIQRLREKLGTGRGWAIKTVWGVGYKFE
jgi:DNA-binding response OmpR family regulator